MRIYSVTLLLVTVLSSTAYGMNKVGEMKKPALDNKQSPNQGAADQKLVKKFYDQAGSALDKNDHEKLQALFAAHPDENFRKAVFLYQRAYRCPYTGQKKNIRSLLHMVRSLQCVQVLLDNGATIALDLPLADPTLLKMTPLTYVLGTGKYGNAKEFLDVADALIAAKATVSIADTYGRTPLFYALDLLENHANAASAGVNYDKNKVIELIKKLKALEKAKTQEEEEDII